jgi:hypothetical protein
MASLFLHSNLFILLKSLLKAKNHSSVGWIFQYVCYYSTRNVNESFSYWEIIILIWKKFTTCLLINICLNTNIFLFPIKMESCNFQSFTFWPFINVKLVNINLMLGGKGYNSSQNFTWRESIFSVWTVWDLDPHNQCLPAPFRRPPCPTWSPCQNRPYDLIWGSNIFIFQSSSSMCSLNTKGQ